jgi:hypothetical protein
MEAVQISYPKIYFENWQRSAKFFRHENSDDSVFLKKKNFYFFFFFKEKHVRKKRKKRRKEVLHNYYGQFKPVDIPLTIK